MKRSIILIIILSVFLLTNVSSLCYGETVYFSPDGKKISKEVYESYRAKNVVKQEIPRENDLDRHGRPLFDDQGRVITYPDQSPNNQNYIYGSNRYSRSKNYSRYKSSDPNPTRQIYKGFRSPRSNKVYRD